jgi:hypothetical protein
MTKLAGALEEAEGGTGIPFIRIDGSTDSRDRLLVCCISASKLLRSPVYKLELLVVSAGSQWALCSSRVPLYLELWVSCALLLTVTTEV